MNRALHIWLGMLLLASGPSLSAAPVVFWAPDSVEAGNTVLFYGGGLAETKQISLARWTDGPAGFPGAGAAEPATAPPCAPIQASENSVKFQLPERLQPGLFEVAVQAAGEKGRPVTLNRPELWFLQPVQLQPGL